MGSPGSTCFDPTFIVLCAGLHGVDDVSYPFRGAIDGFAVSRTIRYPDAFGPRPPVLDEHTLVLLDFDDGIVNTGNLPVTIEVKGEPAFVSADTYPVQRNW